ncbi:MAG: hypothetical protein AAGN46_13140 [Acidobacteriota bacterium]
MRRAAVRWVWAAAASLGLWSAWPHLAGDGDAFRATMAVVPWVALGLERIRASLGVASTGPSSALAWTVFTLVPGIALRHRLGVGMLDPLVALGLLCALGLAVGQVLPPLRRRLGRRLTPRPPWQCFALPLIVYVAVLPWALEQRPADGDEPYYLLVAHSLGEDLDLDLADEYADRSWARFVPRPLEPQPGDPEGPNGEIYSRHSFFLPLLLTPAVALGGRAGAALWMAICAAALAWMLLRLASRCCPDHPNGAFTAWAMLAFASPLVVYSHQIWVELPAALAAAWALDVLWTMGRSRHEVGQGAAGPTTPDWAIFAACLVVLPLFKLRFVLVAAPMLALALLRARQRRWALAGTVLAALAGLGAWNAARFGNPLKMHGRGDVESLLAPPLDYLRGVGGLFWDIAFGLFPAAPVWALLVPAVVLLVRLGDRWTRDLAWIVVPSLLAVAPRLEWYGGWSPPFRYAMVVLPLLALALVPLLDRRGPALRAALAGLGALTLALMALWVVVPGATYDLADGGSHVAHRVGERLDADVARLLPSTVRPRPATWWWIAGSVVVLAPLAFARRGRARLRRMAPALGPAVAVALIAGLVCLALSLPTRRIEAEDVWTKKTRGELVPDRWTLQRPLHRAGWLLPSGGVWRARLVPGGDTVRLRVVAARRGFLRPDLLEIRADDRVLDRWTVPVDGWFEREIGPVEWPAGASLVLTAPQPARRATVGLLIDRVEVTWSDE